MDATEPADRPRVQGGVDVLVALSGAGGGVLSGLVVAGFGFSTLSLAGGLLALLLVPALLRTGHEIAAAEWHSHWSRIAGRGFLDLAGAK